MNVILTPFGLAMIASSKYGSDRTIGAVVAATGLDDVLRKHKGVKE